LDAAKVIIEDSRIIVNPRLLVTVLDWWCDDGCVCFENNKNVFVSVKYDLHLALFLTKFPVNE